MRKSIAGKLIEVYVWAGLATKTYKLKVELKAKHNIIYVLGIIRKFIIGCLHFLNLY